MSNRLWSVFVVAAMSATFASQSFAAEPLPGAPTDPTNPGSLIYDKTVFRDHVKIVGRDVDFFAPAEAKNDARKSPVIIFGVAWTLRTENYRQLFEHLAKKGFAVIVPEYATGMFDQDFHRMASDYASLSQQAIEQFKDYVDPNLVIFSGHSKGGQVAMTAAGIPQAMRTLTPQSVVLFAPAGYNEDYMRNVDPRLPVTIALGDQESIVKPADIRKVFNAIPSQFKQLITVASYTTTQPTMKADHFWILTKKSFAGGRDGLSPFHYYGASKWLIGAAEDAQAKSPLTNSYVYGADTADKGIVSARDQVERSW